MDSSSSTKDADQNVPSEADLAQAFMELTKGEKTAQALEANLTSLEKKLDDLLASFDESERLRVEAANDANANAMPAKPKQESGVEGTSSKGDPKPAAKAGVEEETGN